MRLLFLSLFSILLFSCSKTEKYSDQESLLKQEWVQNKMTEYGSCSCLTVIRLSQYDGSSVVEVAIVDPLCNGINAVYTTAGELLFISNNQDKYNDYLARKTETVIIWECKK